MQRVQAVTEQARLAQASERAARGSAVEVFDIAEDDDSQKALGSAAGITQTLPDQSGDAEMGGACGVEPTGMVEPPAKAPRRDGAEANSGAA